MDRATMADTISRAVSGSRQDADQAAALLQLATRTGLLPPDHYRRHVEDAADTLAALHANLEQLLDLLAYYALLYPEAHDDASGDRARLGDCACGRPAASCPARAAAAAGELTWVDEGGQERALNDAGRPEQPEPTPDAGAFTQPPEPDPS